MEKHFGSASCYFLPLFSAGSASAHIRRNLPNGGNNVNSAPASSPLTGNTVDCDYWLTYLLPDGFQVPLTLDTLVDDDPNPPVVNQHPLSVDDESQLEYNHPEPGSLVPFPSSS